MLGIVKVKLKVFSSVPIFQRDKELADRFLLKPPQFYNYLNQSGCIKLDGVDDANKFDALR